MSINKDQMSAEELLKLTRLGTNAKGRKWPWVQLTKPGDSAEFDIREYDLEKVKRAAKMHGHTYNCRFEFKFTHPILTVVRVPYTLEEIEAVEKLALRQKMEEARLEAEAQRNPTEENT